MGAFSRTNRPPGPASLGAMSSGTDRRTPAHERAPIGAWHTADPGGGSGVRGRRDELRPAARIHRPALARPRLVLRARRRRDEPVDDSLGWSYLIAVPVAVVGTGVDRRVGRIGNPAGAGSDPERGQHRLTLNLIIMVVLGGLSRL